MAQDMVNHHAGVMVNAPVHQVYSLFSHFNDFPKFMSFVKEVTYHDDQSSHWVAEVAGTHEWDAVNEDWVPDRQICWRSVQGLKNHGSVHFQPTGQNQTQVDVNITYDPPAGILGDIGERMGAGKRFDEVLQNDLNNFARMVDMAPTNADDPNWSQYLFHPDSAAARGKTTQRQNATMGKEFSSPENTQTQATPSGQGQSDQARRETEASRTIYPNAAASPDLSRQTSASPSSSPSGYRPQANVSGQPIESPGSSTSDYAPQSGMGGQASEGLGSSASTYSQGGLSQPQQDDILGDRPILDRDIINEPTTASTQSGSGGQASEGYGSSASVYPQGGLNQRQQDDTLRDRPVLDRDIINGPATAAPLDERESSARNRQEYPTARPEYSRENEANLPPEQIPPFRPEGDQPQR